MLFINLICYKYKVGSTPFILFIALKYGWFFKLMQKDKFLFFLNMYMLGIIRRYYLTFHLKGFGFRFLKIYRSIIVKLGRAHRMVLYTGYDNKLFFRSKTLITFSVRTLQSIRQHLLFLYLYYRKYVYKKLGIFFKGLYLNLKLSKKKNKF